MKTRMKKLFALCMAFTLSVGTLAGCGGTKKEEKSVELTKPGTYPIVEKGEKLELTMFTMSMPNVEDFATNDFTKFMEKKTGIKMKFVTAGRDDWEQKLNMMLSTGDYPDMIFGVTPNLAKYGVKEGIIIPIDKYINKDIMPNYTKLMKDYDMNITKETDGKIYSLAGINDCYHCTFARRMWVNKDYLDQMGVDIPKTTDEFMDVCKKFLKFKDKGIAVGGAAKGWHTRMQDWLMGGFTFVPSGSATFNVKDYIVLNDKTKKMECVATTDEYKNGLKYINELYKAGAIYDGDFTQTSEQLKSLVNQKDEPVLFFTAGVNSDIIDPENNNALYRKYVCMPPLKGPDGTQIAWTIHNSGVQSGAVCITDKCKNVEAALRWCDFFYGETGDLSSQFGPDEGKDWVLNPKGKVGLNGEPALYEVLNAYSPEAQNHDWQDVGIRVAPEKYRLGQAVDPNVDPYSPEGLERLLYDVSKKYYEPYSNNTDLLNLNELKVTDAESSDVSTIAVEVGKIMEENAVAFMTGAKDIDKDWKAYVDALDKAGLQKLIDVYQKAYDRQNKNK